LTVGDAGNADHVTEVDDAGDDSGILVGDDEVVVVVVGGMGPSTGVRLSRGGVWAGPEADWFKPARYPSPLLEVYLRSQKKIPALSWPNK